MFNALILPQWGSVPMITSNMHTYAQPAHHHHLAPARIATEASSRPQAAIRGDGMDTLNSKEIAGLAQKSLSYVKRRIERLAKQGVIEMPPMTTVQTATKPANVYVFSGEQGARDSLIVVAQLSPRFTASLVERWQQRESATSPRNALQAVRDDALLRVDDVAARRALP